MSAGRQRVVGQRAPGPDRNLPFYLTALLYALVGCFYAANAYTSAVARPLYVAKWLPLLVLLGIAIAWLQKGSARFVVSQGALLIGLVAVLSTTLGPMAENGVIILASVLLALVASSLLAGLLIQNAAEADFFEIVANVGRVVVVLSALMLAAGLNLGRGAESGRLSAWTDNPNTLAMILAPTLVILMAGVIERRRGWLLRDAAFLALGLVVLQQTGSRAAFGWVALSGVAFYFVRYGSTITMIAVYGAVIAVFGWWEEILSEGLQLFSRYSLDDAGHTSEAILSGRAEAWAIGGEHIQERPLLGFGIGSSQPLLAAQAWRFQEHQGLHFHSSYISVAVETGLIGLTLLAMTILAGLVRGLQHAREMVRTGVHTWPRHTLPFAIVSGALVHGAFESWFLSAGNANTIMFWTCIMLLSGRPLVQRRLQPGRPIRSSADAPRARGQPSGANGEASFLGHHAQ